MLSQKSQSLHDLVLMHDTQGIINTIQMDSKIINLINEEGFSLLQLAAREGLNDLVTYLCFRGADVAYLPEIKDPSTGQNVGKTAYQYALDYGHDHVVAIIDAFNSSALQVHPLTLKALYVWAIKEFQDPNMLTLPKVPALVVCQGLLELAAFLNKPLWAEKLLSFYGNFQLRHNILIRSAGYWAACHNNHELLQKVLLTENNTSLTFWQLQEDSKSTEVSPLFSSLQSGLINLDSLPEDKDDIPARFKNVYVTALKDKENFVSQFSYEAQRVILEHSLKHNNFVPIVVMQKHLKARNNDFLISSLHLPNIVDFELTSQNKSFYEFVLKLDVGRHDQFLVKNCNKIGLLNSLLSRYLIQYLPEEKTKLDNTLSREEYNIYCTLSKNDKLMSQLAETQFNNHKKLNPNSRLALFKFFCLPYSVIPKKKSPVNELSDDEVAHLFLFMKNKKTISLMNRRFYAILSGAKPSLQNKGLQVTNGITLKVKSIGDDILKLDAEIERLERFEEKLEAGKQQNARCWNRFATSWSMAGLLTFPAAFIGNVFCIVKLRSNKYILVEVMSKINAELKGCATYWWEGSTCNTFNKAAWYGCNPLDQITGYDPPIYDGGSSTPRHCIAQIPDSCNALCDQSYWADVDYAVSILTSVVLAISLFGTIPSFLYCYLKARKNSYHLPAEPLSSYPTSLQDETKAIVPLLSQPSGDFSKVNGILTSIEKSIEQKENQKSQLDSEYKNTVRRRRVIKGFFKPAPVEVKQEWPDDIKDEPPKISHVGSLNDDLRTPLLKNQDDDVDLQPQRKSRCPSCVIL